MGAQRRRAAHSMPLFRNNTLIGLIRALTAPPLQHSRLVCVYRIGFSDS